MESLVLRSTLKSEIFTETTVFDYETLQSRIRELAFYLNRTREPLHEQPIYVEGLKDHIHVEVALQYNDSYTENIHSFANKIRVEVEDEELRSKVVEK